MGARAGAGGRGSAPLYCAASGGERADGRGARLYKFACATRPAGPPGPGGAGFSLPFPLSLSLPLHQQRQDPQITAPRTTQ